MNAGLLRTVFLTAPDLGVLAAGALASLNVPALGVVMGGCVGRVCTGVDVGVGVCACVCSGTSVSMDATSVCLVFLSCFTMVINQATL